MQTPTFPALHSRFKNLGSNRISSRGFFQTHEVFEVVRGLFLSSILWVVLAAAVYMVYSMVLGAH
jgi:hypothetical protein